MRNFVLALKFVRLYVFDRGFQGFGHPFVLVVDKLLPYIYIKVAYVKVAKLARELGWAQKVPFDSGLTAVVAWYRENQ
jgi:nucleoside-diphosphate-sugar epimerase